jgi:hypothetical protein
MPRVIVITDHARPGNVPVLLDERVNSVHLSSDHAAMQFVERLGWAISDAEDAERVNLRRPRASQLVHGAKPTARSARLRRRPAPARAAG